MTETRPNAGTILLIEDNEDDIFFMKRALKNAGIKNPIQAIEDGQEAIDFFAGTGPYADRSRFPLPLMTLLDLKLPRKNGLEVLEWIRSQSDFSRLVVIVLTSSRHNKDVVSAARLGANSFLVKPSNVEDLSHLMNLIKEYWLKQDQIVLGA